MCEILARWADWLLTWQVLKLKELNGELQGCEVSQQKLIFSGKFGWLMTFSTFN